MQFGYSTSWDTPISINWFQIANPTTCNRYPTSRYGSKFQPPHRSKQQICASDTWGIAFHHWRNPLSNMTKTSNSGKWRICKETLIYLIFQRKNMRKPMAFQRFLQKSPHHTEQSSASRQCPVEATRLAPSGAILDPCGLQVGWFRNKKGAITMQHIPW